MDWGVLAGFLGASVALTLMPGPDILFVIAQSVKGSRAQGAAIAFGLCTGLLAHISAAALGVSAVVYSIPYAFQAVKIAGALYLFYLAYSSWRSIGAASRSESDGEDSASSETSLSRLYRRGILMNILNPKVSLFFLAFLPQFVSKDGGSVAPRMLALGGLFLVQALVVFNVVAFLAGRIGRRWLKDDGSGRWTGWMQTVLYAGLGIWLFVGG